jgi:hypothetical protein
MKLSASLLSSAAAGGDCLQVSVDPLETLVNPEPRLFVIGNKSFGRFSNYLMRTGIQQVQSIFETLLGTAERTVADREGKNP